jgi:Terminase large subunit, T4likevirus-type, N-terminal
MIAERQRPSVTIKLHKKQMEVYRSKARFRVVVAGRRWGKTSLSRILMITRAKKPRQRIWYVAPTYRMAKQIMWSDLLEAIPKKWVKKISMSVTLINGSKIELRGADKPDSLRGVRIDFLVLDEFQDMVPEVWTQALRPTLADSKGDAIFIGTPKAYNYLYEVYRRGQNPLFVERNLWQSWQFPTVTSPFIPASEIESARKDMDEKSFKQEFEASFETMSGRVYYAFDRKVHVKPCEFNPKLPIWIGMDFNVDPMSMVVLQQQPDGTVWAVDEVVLFGSNTEESCDELEKKYWRNQKQITMYPDPAGNQRQHARGETDLDILREKGFKKIKHRKRHPKVADRVNSVNRMLRAADGSIRLYIDPKCVHLIKSLEQTIYKKGSRDMDKDMGVEHSTDALGYPIELEFPIRKFEYKGHSR